MNNDTQNMIAILERQASTLAQLADIAQTQRDAAHGGDIDAIDRLLDQRLAIAEALAQVEAELASISEHLDRARAAHEHVGRLHVPVDGPQGPARDGARGVVGRVQGAGHTRAELERGAG